MIVLIEKRDRMINIIEKDRGMGKTTALIKESEKTGYPIICPSKISKEHIYYLADKMGCVVCAFTYDEYEAYRHLQGFENVLVDELPMFMRHFHPEIKTATLSLND